MQHGFNLMKAGFRESKVKFLNNLSNLFLW